jgi:hypothetical protein
LRESHYTLSDVDAIADDVGLAVEIPNQSNRAQIDANARRQMGRIAVFRRKRFAQAHRHKKGILGITEEVDGYAVASVEDDAVVLGNVANRFRNQRVEPILQLNLF